MFLTLKSAIRGRWAGTMFLVFAWAWLWPQSASAENPHVLTVMTRNMDAGTDMGFILAATDQASLL